MNNTCSEIELLQDLIRLIVVPKNETSKNLIACKLMNCIDEINIALDAYEANKKAIDNRIFDGETPEEAVADYADELRSNLKSTRFKARMSAVYLNAVKKHQLRLINNQYPEGKIYENKN